MVYNQSKKFEEKLDHIVKEHYMEAQEEKEKSSLNNLIKECIEDNEDYYGELNYTFSIQGKNEVFVITYERMYGVPDTSFAVLKKISDLFGTMKINVDENNFTGCESCDYGSSYSRIIFVNEPTKNIQEFEELCKKT